MGVGAQKHVGTLVAFLGISSGTALGYVDTITVKNSYIEVDINECNMGMLIGKVSDLGSYYWKILQCEVINDSLMVVVLTQR